jgi:hypothetical protein
MIDGKRYRDMSVKRILFLELPLAVVIIIVAMLVIPFAWIYSKLIN